ncbi:hypothetical protein UlMin_014068 [Ulmus minor]
MILKKYSILHLVFILLLSSKTLEFAVSGADSNCQKEYCGGVSIEYPFGIADSCFLDARYKVTCDNSSGTSKPFLDYIKLELLNISVNEATVNISSPILSNCADKEIVDLSEAPFSYSVSNRFTAVGCNNLALMRTDDEDEDGVVGCMSNCHNDYRRANQGCLGLNCCQTEIPWPLEILNVSFQSRSCSPDSEGEDCKFAFMVHQNWFMSILGSNLSVIKELKYVPAVLDFVIDMNGACSSKMNASNTICADNAYCINNSSKEGYVCLCKDGYEGNPYLECRVMSGVGSGSMFFLVIMWWLRRMYKRKKKYKLKKKYFKRNGGLLLGQHLCSSEDILEKTILFSSKELGKATDYYNKNRILGQGGQGTVYKGMLSDGRIVAVKKPKQFDAKKVEEFINEVVILSKINHRNVVKILGCCLETEFPLLVYEFIPNGTLYQHIHDQNEEFPFSWCMRLQVAAEVAAAVSYLHSSACMPIYHRDIKSTNILLDHRFRAKVADFGTSKSVAIGQTHLTTMVRGTFGYMDPEYFRTNQFTEKSDVYSFGVVLVELLTSLKPISQTSTEDRINLAAYFVLTMKEHRFLNIVDTRIVKEARKEEIMAVAEIARRCLDMIGRKRPHMKAVAAELDGIRTKREVSILKSAGKLNFCNPLVIYNRQNLQLPSL